MTIGNRIEKQRHKNNLSQKDLAIKMEVPTGTISEWESDEAFNDRELKEVVNDVLHNKYYTPAQKRELLEGYADIFNAHARVSELAKAQGFTYIPPTQAKPEESKKPQEPELCQ